MFPCLHDNLRSLIFNHVGNAKTDFINRDKHPARQCKITSRDQQVFAIMEIFKNEITIDKKLFHSCCFQNE